jgi:hypothetical protein
MAKRIPDPELDENAKVGLTLISAVYGVVLVAVFPAQHALSEIGVVGWFHLGLTTFMLVVSWMGYYNNRQRYPVWRVQFFNIPLFQYIISFLIIFGYWELGFTIGTTRASRSATPNEEALIILLIYVAYLVWDFLEIAVQESPKYIKALTDAHHDDWRPPLRVDYVLGKTTNHPDKHLCKNEWFARNLRGGRFITFSFCILYAIGLVLAHTVPLHGIVTVCVFDGIYIGSLFLYRYLQWWWPHVHYVRPEHSHAEHAPLLG